MKKYTFIVIISFLLLTTINTNKKISFSKFNIKEIIVVNNNYIKDRDIKILLSEIYDKNLLFLKSKEIEMILMKNSFIDGFNINKKYPDTIKIKIFEKKPIAILFKQNKKFFISENVDLIEYKYFSNNSSFPHVLGDEKEFKKFYNNFKKTKFPLDLVKKFILFDSNRWDIKTTDEKTIKLPYENYIERIENYLEIKDENNFKNYKIFDYRINNQLILK